MHHDSSVHHLDQKRVERMHFHRFLHSTDGGGSPLHMTERQRFNHRTAPAHFDEFQYF